MGRPSIFRLLLAYFCPSALEAQLATGPTPDHLFPIPAQVDVYADSAALLLREGVEAGCHALSHSAQSAHV
jgi:hypothetical protein